MKGLKTLEFRKSLWLELWLGRLMHWESLLSDAIGSAQQLNDFNELIGQLDCAKNVQKNQLNWVLFFCFNVLSRDKIPPSLKKRNINKRKGKKKDFTRDTRNDKRICAVLKCWGLATTFPTPSRVEYATRKKEKKNDSVGQGKQKFNQWSAEKLQLSNNKIGRPFQPKNYKFFAIVVCVYCRSYENKRRKKKRKLCTEMFISAPLLLRAT